MRLFFSIIIITLCVSCSNKKETADFNEKTRPDNVTDKDIILENNENTGIYEMYFIDEIWQCSLPISSSEAVSLGYDIEKKYSTHDSDTGFTYAERYGYDYDIICTNGKNRIRYWENDDDVIIWDFESQDTELIFLNYKFIGENIRTIKSTIGVPSTDNITSLKYENKDFEFELYFENEICIKIEFSRYI